MKARVIELGSQNQKGMDFFLESLRVCAQDHILSKKLLDRVSTAAGTMMAIAPPWFDPNQSESYHQAVQSLPEPSSGEGYEEGYYPRQLLVTFVQEYLRLKGNRVVISENWAWTRKNIALYPWLPPHLACYGDEEVYHIVTPDIVDREMIEMSVHRRHYWQTGVCTACAQVPKEDIPDEAFLNEIVDNMVHLFIPAFDCSGTLIWSVAGGSDADVSTWIHATMG